VKMSLEKAWNEILKRKIIADRRQRAEYHFLNQIQYLAEELADCDLDRNAREVLHRLFHAINHYSFNQLEARRRTDEKQ
jgi:hypothetical protein